MQANEFERSIQQKLEAFKLAPGEEVWKLVEARIAKEKRRRRIIFFWWFIGIMSLGSGAGWWLMHGNDNEIAAVKKNDGAALPVLKAPAIKNNSPAAESKKVTGNEKKTAEKNASDPAGNAVLKARIVKVEPAKKALINSEVAQENLPGKGTDRSKNYKRQNVRAPLPGNTQADPVAKEDKAARPVNATIKEQHEAKGQFVTIEQAGTKQQPGTKEQSESKAQPETKQQAATTTDTLPENVLNTAKANSQKDSAATPLPAVKTAKTVAKEKTNKLIFGFTAYAGASNNLSGFPVVSKSLNAAYSSIPANSTTGNPGGLNNIIVPLHYTSAFSYGFGVYTNLQLHKKAGLSLGIDYHYYSTKSYVGSQMATQVGLYDSLLLRLVDVNAFYNYGQSTTFFNTYRLVEMPVNLLWKINKSRDHGLTLSAGIAPGYLVNSEALYANSRTNLYYVEKRQFKRFQLSGQAAVLYTFIRSEKYSISAGPVLQYGFSNLAKAATATNQHLFFTGLKTTISLK